MTLISKFVLIFFLAKFLQASEVGLYGLLSATIGYALYVVGFEFYNFATREMIGENPKLWLGMIRDQLVLYLILYFVFFAIRTVCFFLTDGCLGRIFFGFWFWHCWSTLLKS
ncbi:hypothetical protein JTY93_08970 [Pseudomonas hygromyciniae]|uniref:Polysaccharide biosynthesis protein n=1 Tax=Pseudomonas hygromyciniae TaxID=2812000 RepID=A0ABX7K3D7_9PSED|nr:hypothetical protein [Pseudomonas hygromyciniae]QSB41468.1 hypothetical protein JTY93_08970 [Pseudomonas hygromyciniae]